MQICVGIAFANDFAKPSGNGGSTQDGIDRGCREIGTQRFKQEAFEGLGRTLETAGLQVFG
jgi:hypothetical protein